MTRTELDTLAHHFTYLALRDAIENVCPRKEAPNVPGPGRWYDVTARVRDSTERQHLQLALKYLEGRGLIIKHGSMPYLVMVTPERTDGEVMPFTLAPAEETA